MGKYLNYYKKYTKNPKMTRYRLNKKNVEYKSIRMHVSQKNKFNSK